MTKLPARPCTDLDCRGRHSARERVALAVSICEGRGVQMTAMRRRVLELLWARGRPTGTYKLIEAVKLILVAGLAYALSLVFGPVGGLAGRAFPRRHLEA